MIYKIGLSTCILAWIFNRTGVFPRYQPHIIVLGNDVGFYITHVVLFLVVWFIFYFLERSFGSPDWISDMNSRQGTSQYLDIFVLLTCFLVGSVSIGAGTLSPYLTLGLILAILAALQSFLLGRERRTRFNRQSSSSTTNIVPITPTPLPQEESQNNLQSDSEPIPDPGETEKIA